MPNHGVRHEADFQWGGRPGAACDELPAVAIDKYYAQPETSFARRTGKAICSRCVALIDCREAALNARNLPRNGVVAADSVSTLWAARSWRNYETGVTDTPPKVERPEWLERPDAAEIVEHTRLMEDEL